MWLSLKVKPEYPPPEPSIYGIIDVDNSDPIGVWIENGSSESLTQSRYNEDSTVLVRRIYGPRKNYKREYTYSSFYHLVLCTEKYFRFT